MGLCTPMRRRGGSKAQQRNERIEYWNQSKIKGGNDSKPIINQSRINQIEDQSNSEPKSIEYLSKSSKITTGAKRVAHSSWEPSWRRLGRVFGANIVPSWRPKSKKNQ